MPYFFREAPPYIFKHLVEREAVAFRAYLGLSADEPIDAFEVADWLGLEVMYLDELDCVPQRALRLLLGAASDDWSGGTLYLPNGAIVAVLNPMHSKARQAATVMEEVGHVHLGHSASVLQLDPVTGLWRRTYDRRTEDEAYWFGSATLVPKIGLKALYTAGNSLQEAARHYGVSMPLVRFRSNLHGLWKRAG